MLESIRGIIMKDSHINLTPPGRQSYCGGDLTMADALMADLMTIIKKAASSFYPTLLTCDGTFGIYLWSNAFRPPLMMAP